MAREERILAIDIGATSIKLCEFNFTSGSNISLARFAHREYEEELSENTRMGVVAGLLRQMLAEGGFQARKALICMSGQSSLMRFNRIRTVNCDNKQIRKLAEFEATQNIPFPIEEVIKDYQLIATATPDAVDIMSVVIKNDIVEQFTGAISQVGCVPILIDVAPAACYNTARANGLGDEDCVIILNIGGRVSNLIFAEGDRFYARTIPIAGYTITQQIAKEFGIGLPEAEELKRHHGFVSLGGAYAEPESETAANVSKIIRNVMGRLHGEITRTINVYCAQQKGSKPAKLYLTGGSSILTYCDTFFTEKLKIPVEYFNPFQCVTLLPTVDRQKLQEVGHMFSEAIGLGLRYATQCPVELSLIPATIRHQQDFNRKKPFFVMSFVSIILMLLVVQVGIMSRTDKFVAQNKELKKLVNANKPLMDSIESANSKADSSRTQYEERGKLLLEQAKWPAILNEIYRIKPDNLWIISMKPIIGEVKPFVTVSEAETGAFGGGGGDMFGGGPAGPGGMFGGGDMFGGGGAMFGGAGEGGGPEGGMFGGGPGGGGGGPSGQTATIAGIELIGCSVMPNKKGVSFHLGHEVKFPFDVEKTMPDQESEQEGEASADASADASAEAEEGTEQPPQKLKSPNEIMAEAMKKAGNTPELAFLAALRNSLLFDADETMTAITFYNTSNTTKNFSSFKIQAKFTMPVEFFQITSRATSGGGDAGMGGGPGADGMP